MQKGTEELLSLEVIREFEQFFHWEHNDKSQMRYLREIETITKEIINFYRHQKLD